MASRPGSDGRKQFLTSSEPRLTACAVMLRQHDRLSRARQTFAAPLGSLFALRWPRLSSRRSRPQLV